MTLLKKRSYFAFIESNTTGTGRLFLNRAIQKGFTPLLLTADPLRYPYLEEDLIQPIIVDTLDKANTTEILKKYSDLKGIFSSSDSFVEIAASLAKSFDLTSNTPESIANTRDKEQLKILLSQTDILIPKTFALSSIKEIEAILENLSFPLVIKPVIGTGSIGVKLCVDKNDCISHANQLLSAAVLPNKASCQKILIQEYIEGDEYSVEVFGLGDAYQIIGITKKCLGNLPYFIEVGHEYPALLNKAIWESASNSVIKALQIMGLKYGATHTEIRIKGSDIYIIEINPRLAGGMIPEMIKAASGVDLINASLDFFSGNIPDLASTHQLYSAIRFILPPDEGKITSIGIDFDRSDKHIVAFELLKKENDCVTLSGDFRDRIGYVITQSSKSETCLEVANNIIKSIKIEVDTQLDSSSFAKIANTGRLKESLHPEAHKIIEQSKSETFYDDLHYYAAIDEAHLIMLSKKKLLPLEKVRPLIKAIKILKEDNFNELRGENAPRGIYLLYENALIEQLGIEVAGVLHMARSRNDINATIFKLKLRELSVSIYKTLWKLRDNLISLAKATIFVVIPIYSQYQTALPGTLAHYLLAIEEALCRDQAAIKSLFGLIDVCPLGAGAGGGTSFSIDPSLTSQLLGFAGASSNSLDAVASRDSGLRAISILSILGMNISRFTEDLQLWSTNEFNFIEFPDNLCGGSSMMPQKKNPYLLEIIKSRALAATGYFVSSISIMSKTPFGNSVEVGTEAVKNIKNVFNELNDAVALLSLIITNLKFKSEIVNKCLNDNLTVSTYLTDILVKQSGYSFRKAHHLVGETIRNAIDNNKNVLEEIFNINVDTKVVSKEPINWAHVMEYGGGPGKHCTEESLQRATDRLTEDADWLRCKVQGYSQAAAIKLKSISEILQEELSW